MHVRLHLEHYFKGEGVSEFLPDTMDHGATWQISRYLMLIYPTLGIGPGHVPQRSDILWPKFNAYISYFGDRTRSRATEVGYFVAKI